MDDQYLSRFRERSSYEAARTGPPEGFPKLRDLPLGRYTDPTFRALEDEHLFKRTWLYAAHDSELPSAGSYALRDIAGANILLARGDDGVVRAFYNACRHRGAPVVRQECGTARVLICQFHSWSYDLSGELVPEAFRGVVARNRPASFCMPVTGQRGAICAPLSMTRSSKPWW